MRKITIMIALCMAGICIYAQQIDKQLLIGRWNLYTINTGSFTLCRDSVPQTIQNIINLEKMGNPNVKMTENDSLVRAMVVTSMMDDMFQTYMIFDTAGTTTVLLGVNKPEDGKFPVRKGTYTWTSGSRISQKLDEGDPVTYIVRTLTDTKLKLKVSNAEGEMIFTRAK